MKPGNEENNMNETIEVQPETLKVKPAKLEDIKEAEVVEAQPSTMEKLAEIVAPAVAAEPRVLPHNWGMPGEAQTIKRRAARKRQRQARKLQRNLRKTRSR